MTFNSTDSAYEQAIPAPAITKAVLDSGLILSYLSYVNSAGNSFVFNTSEGLNVTYTVDTIYLVSTNDLSYANTGWSYRYVIVHGTVTSGNSLSSGPGKGYTKQQLLEMSYQDIKKLFGLQDNISSN
jgi:hypothetical protein